MCRPHTKHTTDPHNISGMTTVPFILPWGVLANRYGITLHAIAVPWKLARNTADYIARQSPPPPSPTFPRLFTSFFCQVGKQGRGQEHLKPSRYCWELGRGDQNTYPSLTLLIENKHQNITIACKRAIAVNLCVLSEITVFKRCQLSKTEYTLNA